VRKAHPNPTHYAVTRLQSLGHISEIITQNVDGLHHAAGANDILELHGTLHNVHCMHCNQVESRIDFQKKLNILNPAWTEFSRMVEQSEVHPRSNPDGDVDLPSNASYETFQYPPCQSCQGVIKPSVIFFGENLKPKTKQQATEMVERCNSILVMGSSLATYSAYRLVRLAKNLGKTIGILNWGITRGDDYADLKIEVKCGSIMPKVAVYFSTGTDHDDSIFEPIDDEKKPTFVSPPQ